MTWGKSSKGGGLRALVFAVGVACFASALFRVELAGAQDSSRASTSEGTETSSPSAESAPVAPSSLESTGGSDVHQLPVIEVTANRPCPEESLYRQASRDFAEGRYAVAMSLLERLLRECPSHPHAGELLRRSRERAVRASPAQVLSSDGERAGGATSRKWRELYGPEDPVDEARGQLVLGQALHGAYQGVMICVAIQCSSAVTFAGLGLLGGVAFGAAAHLQSSNLRPGEATAINSGSLWGIFNGLMIGLPAANRTAVSANLIFATSQLFGGAVGTVAGTAIAVGLRPTAGHVLLADSVGVWSGIVGMMALYGVLDMAGVRRLPDPFWAMLILADAGLVAGAAIGSAYRVTAGRVWWAHLGGFLGSMAGATIGSTASSFSRGYGHLLVPAAVGAAAGFGMTLVLTHGMDYPTPRVQTSLAPVGPEGTAGMTAGVVF